MMLSLANHAYRDYWYLEVDLASESLPVLMHKCHAYEDYRHTGQAQQEHQVFPRVLWVMPTPERITRVKTAIAADRRLPDRLFVFATPAALIPTLREPP